MTDWAIIDELMANAWPPAIREYRGDWLVRWADGFTRRANSALPVGQADQVPTLVSDCEQFYRDHRATPVFQVSTASAPPGLVDHLVARRYRGTARTLVAQALVQDVIANTRSSGNAEVEQDHVPDAWFDGYWEVEASRGRSGADAKMCRDTLLQPTLPRAYATVRALGEVAGVGQIVVERGWAGVQCMATRTGHRRRGAAIAVLHCLAVEAAARGAERMYLAVMADNLAAQRLYQRATFRPAHEYRYFTATDSD
jgi:ribosomal protein S18 acetylase RimI-like enzyme